MARLFWEKIAATVNTWLKGAFLFGFIKQECKPEDFAEQNWQVFRFEQNSCVFLSRLQSETCKPTAIIILLSSITFGCSERSQVWFNKNEYCSAQAHSVLFRLSTWKKTHTSCILRLTVSFLSLHKQCMILLILIIIIINQWNGNL